MEKIYAREYYLSAGECGPQQIFSPSLVVDRCIAIATDHANALNFGYRRLSTRRQSWVLSRLAYEMESYPRVDETYTVQTWVESSTKVSSVRNFRFLNCRGEVCGHATSVWVAIDVEKRTLADISWLEGLAEAAMPELKAPIAPCGRHRSLREAAESMERRFRYSDLDTNRHVNTVRYVQMLLDCRSLEFFDRHRVSRLEVSFYKECLYGETAQIRLHGGEERTEAEITVGGERRVHFLVEFVSC